LTKHNKTNTDITERQLNREPPRGWGRSKQPQPKIRDITQHNKQRKQKIAADTKRAWNNTTELPQQRQRQPPTQQMEHTNTTKTQQTNSNLDSRTPTVVRRRSLDPLPKPKNYNRIWTTTSYTTKSEQTEKLKQRKPPPTSRAWTRTINGRSSLDCETYNPNGIIPDMNNNQTNPRLLHRRLFQRRRSWGTTAGGWATTTRGKGPKNDAESLDKWCGREDPVHHQPPKGYILEYRFGFEGDWGKESRFVVCKREKGA